MKNPKVQCVVVAVLFLAAGLLLIPSLTQAKTKDLPWQDTEPQRDGYSRSFVVDANSMALIEVPEGRCYVLLRVYARVIDYEPPYIWDDSWVESLWTLTVDGEVMLSEFGLSDPYEHAGLGIYAGDILREEFPDQTVVVGSGQTLGISRHKNLEYASVTLVGYFCDAQ